MNQFRQQQKLSPLASLDQLSGSLLSGLVGTSLVNNIGAGGIGMGGVGFGIGGGGVGGGGANGASGGGDAARGGKSPIKDYDTDSDTSRDKWTKDDICIEIMNSEFYFLIKNKVC